jgi:hypothetical protein
MKWDQDRILNELRQRHRRRKDLSQTGIRDDPIFSACFRHFGSYRKAVELAGIDYQTVWRRRLTKWNCDSIIRELKLRAKRGEDIWSRGLRITDTSLHAAAIHWFGSYRAAVEAAGLNYDKICHCIPNTWNRETVVAEIQRLHRKSRPLHHARLERTDPCLVIAMYRYFGSFRKAIGAAGLDYATIRVRPARTWHRPRVIRELKQLHREKNGLWNRAVRRRSPYLLRAAKQLFGSVPRALRAAGVPLSAAIAPKRRRRPLLSKSEILLRLQELDAAGADLRATALNVSERHLYVSLRHRFGDHRTALLAAGAMYPPRRPLRHWTWPLVVDQLREAHRDGEDLRHSTMKRSRRPLFEAAKYYFGSYVNAVAQAGINYDEVVRKQLAKARSPRLRKAG